MEEELPADDRRAGPDVQTVGQPGKPASLGGVEDVPPLELNAADDQSGVGHRERICRGLGQEAGRKQECREQQQVPKVQPNSR